MSLKVTWNLRSFMISPQTHKRRGEADKEKKLLKMILKLFLAKLSRAWSQNTILISCRTSRQSNFQALTLRQQMTQHLELFSTRVVQLDVIISPHCKAEHWNTAHLKRITKCVLVLSPDGVSSPVNYWLGAQPALKHKIITILHKFCWIIEEFCTWAVSLVQTTLFPNRELGKFAEVPPRITEWQNRGIFKDGKAIPKLLTAALGSSTLNSTTALQVNKW